MDTIHYSYLKKSHFNTYIKQYIPLQNQKPSVEHFSEKSNICILWSYLSMYAMQLARTRFTTANDLDDDLKEVFFEDKNVAE